MTYQIKDWNLYFENDRSRQREKCSFVCVPNKQHGMGFGRIMLQKDGAAIYGIWCLILGACSQQKKRNGWLTDDGERTGTPWGADDLAVKFRRPIEEIQRALEFICSAKVGWMETHEITNDDKAIVKSHRQVTAKSPPNAPEGNRREGKGNERTEGNGKKEEKGSEIIRAGGSLSLPLTPHGKLVVKLTSLCEEILGSEEMKKHHKRWMEKIQTHPLKLERVLAEVRIMKVEQRIETTPARVAEDLWKRFK
jgi:hypothetical protein